MYKVIAFTILEIQKNAEIIDKQRVHSIPFLEKECICMIWSNSRVGIDFQRFWTENSPPPDYPHLAF